MERLTTRNEDGLAIPTGIVAHVKVLEKLADYEDLDEQGLLLKLHFGKEDVVYEIVKGGDGKFFVFPRKCHTYSLLIILNEKVGKTVFLTKAEAEKELEEMKGE